MSQGLEVKSTADGAVVKKVLVAAQGKEAGSILTVLEKKGFSGILSRDGFDLTSEDLVFLGDEVRFQPSKACETRTPPKPTFIKLLQEKQLTKGSTREEIIDWVNSLPISTSTKEFLESKLHQVDTKMYVTATLGAMVHLLCIIRRLDYKKVFTTNDSAKLLVLFGIRRQGKTCALPMELVHARLERFGVKDRAMFYYSGLESTIKELGPSSLNIVLLILAYAGIPSCWDEFQFFVDDLGRAYKYLLEQPNVNLEPLSVVMWGSSEPHVQEKAGPLMSGLRSRGAFSFFLPEPTIEVLIGIYYLSRGCYKELSYFEPSWNSKDFLSRFTIYGYDLEAFIAQGDKEVGIEEYKVRLEHGLCKLWKVGECPNEVGVR